MEKLVKVHIHRIQMKKICHGTTVAVADRAQESEIEQLSFGNNFMCICNSKFKTEGRMRGKVQMVKISHNAGGGSSMKV